MADRLNAVGQLGGSPNTQGHKPVRPLFPELDLKLMNAITYLHYERVTAEVVVKFFEETRINLLGIDEKKQKRVCGIIQYILEGKTFNQQERTNVTRILTSLGACEFNVDVLCIILMDAQEA